MPLVRLSTSPSPPNPLNTMPALDVHHQKSFEPALEHVYVAVPDEDHTRSTLTDAPSAATSWLTRSSPIPTLKSMVSFPPAPCACTHAHLLHHQAKGNCPKSASLITTERLRTVGHHRSSPPETQARRPRITRNIHQPAVPHLQGRVITSC